MEFLRYVVIALIGALASLMANKGIAVFNDGFRPVLPEYYSGKMDRKALAATSFAVSFGLVVGFGIPTSIGASIILAHSVLLGTDIIGVSCSDSKMGQMLSAGIGAVYGIGLLIGLEFLSTLFAMLPVDFVSNGNLGLVSSPIIIAFAIFPAVATAYQAGLKKGFINAGVTMLAYKLMDFVTAKGWLVIAGNTVSINSAGIAMLVGVILMVVFGAGKKSEVDAESGIASVFKENVERIKGNWYWFVATGALISMSACLAIMAGDPTSLNLVSTGDLTNAALVAFVRAIGFIPLVVTTAVVTGVYTPAGITFTWAIGIAASAFIGSPVLAVIVAGVGGGAMMFVEVHCLTFLAGFLDKYEGIRDMGGHIRNAMNQVLEVALLIGGLLACQAIMPSFGYLFLIGLWLLNKAGKKPIVVPLAVGPLAAILCGLLANLLTIIGLM